MSVLNQTNSTLRLFEVLILRISVWGFLFGLLLFVCVYLFVCFVSLNKRTLPLVFQASL